MVINRSTFDACISSRFKGVKRDAQTHRQKCALWYRQVKISEGDNSYSCSYLGYVNNTVEANSTKDKKNEVGEICKPGFLKRGHRSPLAGRRVIYWEPQAKAFTR